MVPYAALQLKTVAAAAGVRGVCLVECYSFNERRTHTFTSRGRENLQRD